MAVRAALEQNLECVARALDELLHLCTFTLRGDLRAVDAQHSIILLQECPVVLHTAGEDFTDIHATRHPIVPEHHLEAALGIAAQRCLDLHLAGSASWAAEVGRAYV